VTGGSYRIAVAVCIALPLAACSAPDDPAAGVAVADTPRQEAAGRAVTALGRLEPREGIIRVAGPSRPSVVIATLLLEEGARVAAGQPIAILDTQAEDAARVVRTKAELANAEHQLSRIDPLVRQGIAPVSTRDDAQLKVDVARAELVAAQATLDRDTVRAPEAGQIVKVHARSGERVGPDGIAELAQTDSMYALAQVYETDIGRVKVGQHAVIRSPALDPELTGVVDRIGMKVEKLDVVDADPVTRTDARVVEVHIKVNDGARAARLSNLQVDVAIEP
jgi:HlyD family secretion protein